MCCCMRCILKTLGFVGLLIAVLLPTMIGVIVWIFLGDVLDLSHNAQLFLSVLAGIVFVLLGLWCMYRSCQRACPRERKSDDITAHIRELKGRCAPWVQEKCSGGCTEPVD